jgi:hypothetical protein
MRRSRNWLRGEVDHRINKLPIRRESIRFSDTVGRPTWWTPAIVTVVFVAVTVVQWAFVTRWPGTKLNLPTGGQLTNLYTAMWQVQAGVAAVALPLLLFVIETSRDERQDASRRAEVLIRYSYALPAICIALLTTVHIGVSVAKLDYPASFALDFGLFSLTISLTVVAYLKVLLLLFSPARLRGESIRLIRGRAILASIETWRHRLSLDVLSDVMVAVGLGFSTDPPTGPGHYYPVNVKTGGTLTDIHLQKLKEFVWDLPWTSRPGPGRPPAVWIAALPGYHLNNGDPLLFLDHTYFGRLSSRWIRSRVRKTFRVDDRRIDI